jgi:uncharacterized repeat protein (TIGR01451 family)
LFNNIFWDNRAGTRNLSNVSGLNLAGANFWDLGVADGPGLLTPTNSVIQQNVGAHAYTASPTNSSTDPLVVQSIDIPVTFNTWRNNPAFLGAIMVSADLPPSLMGNYRLTSSGTTSSSPAFNLGVANIGGVNAPLFDIDNQARPANGGYDAGADEVPGPGSGAQADLSISKTDSLISVYAGTRVTYTIVVHNSGPSAVIGATVTDAMPTALTGVTWTCSATGGTGTSCGGGGGTGNINRAINLGTTPTNRVTFTVTGTVLATATGTLANTATVTAPTGTNDPNSANNSATDTDQILVPTLPTLGLLDDFNRTDAARLGPNWSQPTGNGAVIRLNGYQAQCALLGNCLLVGTAMWNGTGNIFGSAQGAAFTFTNGTAAGGAASLYLKASGGTASAPVNFIRVRPIGTTAVVETTSNGGGTFTTTGSFSGANFANGDRLTAVANADGSVDVWKTTSVTTYLGHSAPAAAFAGGGRIGLQLLVTATVDNFSGGTLP